MGFALFLTVLSLAPAVWLFRRGSYWLGGLALLVGLWFTVGAWAAWWNDYLERRAQRELRRTFGVDN